MTISPLASKLALTAMLVDPHVCAQGRTLAGAIFDVDGVLVASPHEHAWREALAATGIPPGSQPSSTRRKLPGSHGWMGLALRWRAWASPRPPRARPSMPRRNRRSSTG
jgi:hypothetical protein